MPLIRIDALRADADRLDSLGRAVHDALVETIGIPPDDLFQVLTSHDGTTSALRDGGFPGVDRDDDIVFVAITMRAGRSDEVKQSMYRRIADRVHTRTGTDPRNILISVTENASPDWSFAYGQAHYLS